MKRRRGFLALLMSVMTVFNVLSAGVPVSADENPRELVIDLRGGEKHIEVNAASRDDFIQTITGLMLLTDPDFEHNIADENLTNIENNADPDIIKKVILRDEFNHELISMEGNGDTTGLGPDDFFPEWELKVIDGNLKNRDDIVYKLSEDKRRSTGLDYATVRIRFKDGSANDTVFEQWVPQAGTQKIKVRNSIPDAGSITIDANVYSNGTAEYEADGTRRETIIAAGATVDYEFLGWSENGVIISDKIILPIPFEPDRERDITAEYQRIDERTEYIVLDLRNGPLRIRGGDIRKNEFPTKEAIGFQTIAVHDGIAPIDSGTGGYGGEIRGAILGNTEGKPLFKLDMTYGGSNITLTALDGTTEDDDITYDFTDEIRNNYPYLASYGKYRGLKILFPERKHIIEVTVEPAAAGTVSGAGEYHANSVARLNAIPEIGYEFAGWYEGGALISRTAEFDITADRDRSLNAKFNRLNEDTDEEQQPQTATPGDAPENRNIQTATPSNAGNGGRRSSGGSSSSGGHSSTGALLAVKRAENAVTVLEPGAANDSTGGNEVHSIEETDVQVITVETSKYAGLPKTGDKAEKPLSEYILITSGMLLLLLGLFERRRYV